jgi:hypothetical protein
MSEEMAAECAGEDREALGFVPVRGLAWAWKAGPLEEEETWVSRAAAELRRDPRLRVLLVAPDEETALAWIEEATRALSAELDPERTAELGGLVVRGAPPAADPSLSVVVLGGNIRPFRINACYAPVHLVKEPSWTRMSLVGRMTREAPLFDALGACVVPFS